MSSGDSSSSRTRPCETLGPRFDPPSVSRGPRVSRGEARTSAAAGGSPPAREVLEWSGDGNASLADGKTPPDPSNSSDWVWVVPKVVADATCATTCGPSTPPVVLSNPCGLGKSTGRERAPSLRSRPERGLVKLLAAGAEPISLEAKLLPSSPSLPASLCGEASGLDRTSPSSREEPTGGGVARALRILVRLLLKEAGTAPSGEILALLLLWDFLIISRKKFRPELGGLESQILDLGL
eukprot:6867745-Lingulodinium_polyedra.AAC.1